MHTKRIASGYGKKPKWVVTPRGPHRKEESIPLLMVVRDILKYADNAREARRIINKGMILVDKKPRKDPRYGVGLMDVIEIPKTGEYFRVLPGKKRHVIKKINEKESNIKPCKIIDKRLVKKGRIQLNLHDGGNILVDDNKYKPGDTVILELPDRKIKDWIKFERGNVAMIVRGRHSGDTGKIDEIFPGSAIHKSLTTMGDLQTLTEYIFVIGRDKPMIET
ncbi:MAG: 30S ribosomal protein S4e [Candidatus Altiarchaeales archaeon]|nr:MAG: 30S ribosomal protein S4e [Candidatus Altiarchaeales archaeon ex4484_43]RLI92882.1 MAG: 30S ribosomal protein S4e [Candidatus Altiarchaeales archaeon]